MDGDIEKKSKGIVPRTFNYIFNQMNSMMNNENSESKNNCYKYSIYLSFIQIYLESIQDLLDPESKEIRIREDPEKGVYLEGTQWVRCNSPEECKEVYNKGKINRNTESTKMNAHSSRSHAILIMKIEKSIKINNEKKENSTEKINNKNNKDRLLTCSHLYLVDLAGSERVRKTGATEMRLEEAKKINLSLLALGNVISSLTDPNIAHISYRDSKLTRILQESLGGNAKTCLIVTVSPSTYNTEETLSSLQFALRAMKVQNKPKINKSIDYQALYLKVQDDLDKLNDEYGKLKIEYDKVCNELEKIKKGEAYIELQKKCGINNESLSNEDFNTSTGGNTSESNNSNKVINYEDYSNNSNEKKGNSNISERKSNNNENVNHKEHIKKIKAFYENLMKNKSYEYETILKKVDDIIFKKETEIEKLTTQINSLNNTIKNQKADIDDLTKEKDDLQNSVVSLTNQVYEQKNLLKNDKTEKEYKALIEILNDNIAALEKKIGTLEDQSTITETSKEKLYNSLDSKINEFQSKLNSLVQEKNNCIIKKSQNEIKIKLINTENNAQQQNSQNEIINLQKQNFELLIKEETTSKKIEIVKNEINTSKKIKSTLETLLEKYIKKNKGDLIMTVTKVEIDNILFKSNDETYNNILLNLINSQHDSKFNEYKIENDLNNIINKSSLLLNNYLNHINKLDDINRELDIAVNEPENFDKLNSMREQIQSLIEESEEINNITKYYNNTNYSKNINNISIKNCAAYLEKITSNMSENFMLLIDTYNVTNSNICQLISLMEESFCYKKKFISNLSSFVQENVKDDFIRQNILFKLANLLKNKFEEQEYNKQIEEIIKELFSKITQSLIEKDKENTILNQRVDLYMKQIDTNIKKINIKRKNNNNMNNLSISANFSDNEISKLKQKIASQQKTINSTKEQVNKMNKNIDKVNEYIKLSSTNNIKLDTNKIYNALGECKNIVKSISNNINKDNSNSLRGNKCYDDQLRESFQTENKGILKNATGDTAPNFLLKQYFLNITKFSKGLINYSYKEEDEDSSHLDAI